MKKKKSKFKIILHTIFIFNLVLVLSSFTYFFIVTKDLSDPFIEGLIEEKHSEIYDSSNRKIKVLGDSYKNYLKYEEIPQNLIDALISIEDREFFNHHGINFKRIASALFNNLTSDTRQGGSTITQQLVKNLLLSNEISLNRKIQEAYLAYKIEEIMSKEEILEHYFNRIYFEGTVPGVAYASRRFFGKEISSISLSEAALLAGVVKSPTRYNPFNHPQRADERKNVVLKAMLDNKKITTQQYQEAIKVHTSDLMIPKGSLFQEESYDFQAYLDVVYLETQELTGLNPYSMPLKIETYLDTSIQAYIDQIQKGENFKFSDDLLQIGMAVIQNDSTEVIAVAGGRNYNGERLYSRAYTMKRQPASTMKPILTYALAMEYLDFNELTMIEDKPYTYPGTNITVHNADKNYLGEISVLEALGYSRNTSTLFTLEKVINKISEQKVIEYMNSIGIMDNGTFSLPYGIGGMTYGLSPISLAGAYTIFPNQGQYLKPSTIKKISTLDGEILYERDLSTKEVISKESAGIMTSTLHRVIEGNYYNIQTAKPDGIQIAGKTGTNSYDKNVISKFNYPSSADRDIWFAGYTPDYTIAVWTGFDEPKKDELTYFKSGDSRRQVAKQLFKKVLGNVASGKHFSYPNTLHKINVVKGLTPFYLPNDLIPSNFISYAYFKKENIPTTILPYPEFSPLENISLITFGHNLSIDINETLIEDDIYSKIFSDRGFLISIYQEDNLVYEVFTTDLHLEIPLLSDLYHLEIKETYKEKLDLHGPVYELDFLV